MILSALTQRGQFHMGGLTRGPPSHWTLVAEVEMADRAYGDVGSFQPRLRLAALR